MDEDRSNGLAITLTAALLLARHLSHGLDLLSLLMLVPWLVCLVPVCDSLQGSGCFRLWERGRMGFIWVDRRQAPWTYWINLLVCWPAAGVFAWFLLKMPPRRSNDSCGNCIKLRCNFRGGIQNTQTCSRIEDEAVSASTGFP
jgi:hypothetical protein